MSGHGWVKIVVSAVCVLSWCAVGCSTSKQSARQDEATNREVLYSPPEDDGPVQVPPGAPLASDYELSEGAVSTSARERAPLTSQPGSGQITRADLEQLLAEGPGWGLVQVKVRPVKEEGGALLGYEVYELTEGASLWLAPAIQLGDRITHLNGVQIRTPDDYMEAWNMSREVEELRIDYVRDGEANYSSWSVVD